MSALLPKAYIATLTLIPVRSDIGSHVIAFRAEHDCSDKPHGGVAGPTISVDDCTVMAILAADNERANTHRTHLTKRARPTAIRADLNTDRVH